MADEEIRLLERRMKETGSVEETTAWFRALQRAGQDEAKDFNLWLQSRRAAGDNVALPGIWCPWAQVLCFECHGEEYHNGRFDRSGSSKLANYKERLGPDEVIDGCGVCECCVCGREIQVDEDVAACKRFVTAANLHEHLRGELQQTGGMCCAAMVTGVGERANGRVVILSDISASEEEGLVFIAVYASEDAWSEGEYEEDLEVEPSKLVETVLPMLLKEGEST